MVEKKTLRLVLPQWQGGNNPNYAFGCELLSHIVPTNPHMETVTVPINKEFHNELKVENGIEGESILLTQIKDTYKILEDKDPDKIIIIGGDCSVSQVPFDFLNGKYKDNLGILWLDAHPDVSTVENSTRNHEMVLNNLITGKGSNLAETVKNPIDSKRVMLAGLIYDELREKDQFVNTKSLKYATPSQLMKDSDTIVKWVIDNNIEYLAVHFDLDVLSPEDYRSIYPAEPYIESFGAAIGQLTLDNIVRILNDTSNYCDIVGLTIAEHLPWDAFRLRSALSEISIFKD